MVLLVYMSDTQFKVDQKIVYPSQGVGCITEVFEKKEYDSVINAEKS